jgi:hypothetical protein
VKRLAIFGLFCGCATEQTVLVHFAGEPDDALVTIDDRYVDKLGRIEKRGIKLPAGEHRVTVEQVGYFPYDVIIVADPDQPTETVKVELTEVPD